MGHQVAAEIIEELCLIRICSASFVAACQALLSNKVFRYSTFCLLTYWTSWACLSYCLPPKHNMKKNTCQSFRVIPPPETLQLLPCAAFSYIASHRCALVPFSDLSMQSDGFLLPQIGSNCSVYTGAV